jgi:translocation and assembly module TamB
LGGVQIDVNLKSRNEGSYSSNLNDKQLAVNLSKQLFNDRLTVSVGSNVGLGSTSNTGGTGSSANVNDVKNVIGDFSMQYRLVQSGRISLRFFRKLDPNILNATSNEVIGASILHTKSFNKIKNMFQLRRRKQRQRPEIMQ